MISNKFTLQVHNSLLEDVPELNYKFISNPIIQLALIFAIVKDF